MSDTRAHLHVVRNGDDAPALPLPADDEQHGTDLEPRPDAELEQDIVEGEIVEETLPAHRPQRPLSPRPMRAIAVRLDNQAPAIRGALAIAITTTQGCHSWASQIWDSLCFGVYRRQIRAAEAAGDREALAEWVDRRDRAVRERHVRLMDMPMMLLGVAKVAGVAMVGGLVLLLMLSIAVWATGVGEFTAVWSWIAAVIRFVLTILGWLWPAITVLTPVAVGFAAWREGRRVGTPTWLVGSDDGPEGRDVIPDEGAILNALRHMGISPLNKAFKDGWRPRFPLPTQRDGKGYRTQLELPAGVTVEMINLKKKVLAHNLVRLPIEVWPTEPKDKPGVLDLWVADQGALSGPVDPWPLLHQGQGDYFRGIPVAVDIRGRSIIGRLFEANYATAGMMGSGKSTLIITLLLGALLDPLVDADVFVLAENADYAPMKPRLRTLRTGAGSDVVEACMATLRGAYNELSVRGQALKEHDARAVTRELAEKDARLRPRILVIDECQALFMDEEFGEEAMQIAVKLESAARKYAVTLIYATPEPSSDSLPRKLIAITSNKACFAIGDQISNDAILGTGSYKAGISAVGLEPKTDESLGDVGTFMARGFTPKPGLLRGYYVSQEEARMVVDRAMKIREQAGIGSTAAAEIEADRDLLEDLATVLGSETIRAAKLPALLAKLAPRWAPYRTLTGKQLLEDLDALGVKVPSTGNVWLVSPELIREALGRRAAAREEEYEDES